MKKIVISAGPIPARLDSVKFITNRFKGGLAMKTATYLAEWPDNEVTLVVWKFTDISAVNKELFHEIVFVSDVFEYFNWFAGHANDYDAFVMAAAVANLTPVSPYEGKFPSHNYKPGDEFDIRFMIAPRAIDEIKRRNPRACLIGYKLFDAQTDEELIDIARHTLEDSKANIIFANTPKDAKTRKIALMQDGSAVVYDFDQHMALINRAIWQQYYTTEIEKPNGSFWSVIKAGSLLALTGESYVVHRHADVGSGTYIFPGTQEEYASVQWNTRNNYFEEPSHGYLKAFSFGDVDWEKYHAVFPDRYFTIHPDILDTVDQYLNEGKKVLELGGNEHPIGNYSYDPFVRPLSSDVVYVTMEDVLSQEWDLVIANNSVNYLSIKELTEILKHTKAFMANTFAQPPYEKITENEYAVFDPDTKLIHHGLLLSNDQVLRHTFYGYSVLDYEKLGLKCEYYGKNSVIVKKGVQTC